MTVQWLFNDCLIAISSLLVLLSVINSSPNFLKHSINLDSPFNGDLCAENEHTKTRRANSFRRQSQQFPKLVFYGGGKRFVFNYLAAEISAGIVDFFNFARKASFLNRRTAARPHPDAYTLPPHPLKVGIRALALFTNIRPHTPSSQPSLNQP